jgi:hypothetical protein
MYHRMDARDARQVQAQHTVAWAWTALSAAVGLHVLDESLHGFLPIWNATVSALRDKYGWILFPTFSFEVWLGGLVAGILAMLALIPAVYLGARWTRPVAWGLALIMIGNAIGHTVATIYGRTVESVEFAGPMPGFASSPFLLAAALYLLWAIRREQQVRGRTAADSRA